jgi:hypothetical protein
LAVTPEADTVLPVGPRNLIPGEEIERIQAGYTEHGENSQ